MKPLLEIKNIGYIYRIRKSMFGQKNTHLAFNNISFNINKGDIIGIFGPNGSGKSTLLKVIADILKPSSGLIINRNVRASLLSLSIGFDPKLSGYDNVILSGMLQGMTKKHMLSKINDIYSYSELNEWFNKPLYTYSTGMRARLGFSISINIDSELLLLDEILSVGDINFRTKATEYMMNSIFKKTLVIVSHNKDMLKKICTRIIEM